MHSAVGAQGPDVDRETTLDEFAEPAEESAEGTGSDGESEEAVVGEDEVADAAADEVAVDAENEVTDATADEVAVDAQADDERGDAARTEGEPCAQTTEHGDGGASHAESGEDDCHGANPDSSASEPLDLTSRWTPDGGPCDRCGSDVPRRWRDSDGLVCAECRDW